ncbi:MULTISPECIES: hypothetical protein [Methylobacterium]|uniref:Uncharacterized protein n=1 Tax=Methylobacterium aquaticum TaxID=270351 RepID=A0A0C6FQK3_9HYPH|nr:MULTISPECIES: hypothetical protein [Methylobacterium]NGM37141.1 hypothetical protein [Methylobacterium sp. DB0501]BAQ47579.1 hypothetical protein Maq22A_c23075 [Methylobacterium aquaticum]
MNAHTPTPPTCLRPDDGVAALLQELIDACPPSPEPERTLTDVARSSSRVGKKALHVQRLMDRAAAGEHLAHEIWAAQGQLDDERALLGGYIEIAAIGSLGGRPYTLAPAWGSAQIAVYRTNDDTLAFRYPRGLGYFAVMALLDAFEAGVAEGRRAASEGP